MSTLKRNLVYSVLLVLANYVFPFLTYPYVSRVLGVANIGACNFVDSVINYFILFSMLGIDSLGVREIAKHKGDRTALNKAFSNLFIVTLSLTIIMLVFLIILTFTLPQLYEHKDLMFFGAFKLVFNCLLVEWLFKGLEDFRLITLRSIIIKLFYVAAVFLFVKKRDDVWIYYMLSSMMVVINACVNILYARNRVNLSFRDIDFFVTLKGLFTLGLYAILTSMYTTFNVTFLGFASGDTEVGYYSTAIKIYGIVMALFSAFTNVMIPRMSNVVANGDILKFKSYFRMAVDILYGFSIPIIVWMITLSKDIVLVIAGQEFTGAVVPLTIISPLLFIIGYEQILVLQTLIPLEKDKLLLRNSFIGAGLGVVLNLIIVPLWGAVGAAIVWAISEMVILILSQYAVTKVVSISFSFLSLLKNTAVYLPLVPLFIFCGHLNCAGILKLVVSMIITGIYIYVLQRIMYKRDLLKIILSR